MSGAVLARHQLDRKKIPALDGVRAIAVAMVLFGHFGFESVPAGHGVVAFFVLSGFLITWLLLGEDERTGGVSLRGFYWRRALRILPAFYAFMAVALAILLATGRHVWWGQVGWILAYAANYYDAFRAAGAGNGVFSSLWSLAVEEQFYFLWPMAFVALRRRPRVLVGVLAGAIGAVWAYRAALVLSGGSERYVYRAFETRADHLLVGCLLAVLLKRGIWAGFWNATGRAAWMPLVPLAALAASVWVGQVVPGYHFAVGYAVEPLVIAVLLVQLVSLSGTAAWRWLDWAPIAWTGRISYSLYLYQTIGMGPYVLPGKPTWLRFAVSIAATYAMAAASHHLVERPFLRLKDRKPRAAAAGAPAAAA